MLVTFFLLAFIAFSFAYKIGKRKFAYIIVFLSLVFLKTFVDINSLPDLEYYQSGYLELMDVPWLQVPTYWLYTLKCPEMGFRYLLKFASFLGSFRWLLFFIALVNTYSYLNLTKRYSPFVIVSILLVIFGSVQSFFVIRQHTAIALTLLSFPYIIKRDLKRFLLYVSCAFLCHQTAIIFIPVYFIYGIKQKRNLFFLLLGIAILFFFFINLSFNYFAVSLEGYEGYENSNEGNSTPLFIALLHLFLYVFFLGNNVFNEGEKKLVFILLSLSTLFFLFGYKLTGISRLMMYYSCSFLSVPITAKYISNKEYRIMFLIIMLALNIYLYISGSNSIYLENFKLIHFR